MKYLVLLLILFGFIGTAFAQYMGNLNPYNGNHSSQEPFPTEPLSLETLAEIKKIIIADDAFQNIVNGKPFSFYDGNGYAGSTGTEEWDPVIMLNVNNETSVSILFNLTEKKILKIDSYEMERSFPAPDVSYGQNTNEMSDIDTEPASIEEKLQIASKSIIPEYDQAGSAGPPLMDMSVYLITLIIIGVLIGMGFFLGLMIYWRKRK